MHLCQYFLHIAAEDDSLGHLLFSVGQLPVTFQDTVSHCHGLPLGPIALVAGAPVTDIPHSGHCPASISRISGPTSSPNCSLLGLVSPGHKQLQQLLSTPFNHLPIQSFGSRSTPQGMVAWKGCLFVFNALTVFKCEVLLLHMLSPTIFQPLQIPKPQQPGRGGVVGAPVKLLSIQILVEMLQCLHNCQQLLMGNTVVLLGLGQSFAEVSHNQSQHCWCQC